MEELHFINLLATLLYKTQKESVGLKTQFKKLQEWNLLFAVSCTLMVEEEYHVSLNDCDFLETETIEDLYSRIQHQRIPEL